jgi:methylated-DNA-protein-cysteine methyltransferase-like protein
VNGVVAVNMADRPSAFFRARVYEIVAAIPPGRVMTYGAIASLIPVPPGSDWLGYRRIRARWVGYALADCDEDLPWHRVVNAQGGISLRRGHGPHIQRNLLRQEGVVFNERGRVDLRVYAWLPDRPRDAADDLRGDVAERGAHHP